MDKTEFLAFLTAQIRRLALHFRLPYDLTSREGAMWLNDIAEALYGTGNALLEAAVGHLIKNHKGRFPAIVEIRAAISAVAKDVHASAAPERKLLAGTSGSEYENLKAAVAWLNGDIGQQALREGWAADFAAQIRRGETRPQLCEPIQRRASWENFASMLKFHHPIWAGLKQETTQAYRGLAVSIARRAQKTRAKYLHDWDERLEPYNDPAWAIVQTICTENEQVAA